MKTKIYTFLFLTISLAGCTGAGGEKYLGMPGSPAWFATAGPKTISEYFSSICIGYGFTMGTPEMAQCIQTEAVSSRQQNAIRGAAIANATALNRPRTYNCNTYGRQVNCTGY